MENHFCNCPTIECSRNPKNHNNGCDPCIIDNLKKKKMPACFFIAVNEDVSNVTDYSINGFVQFYLQEKE